MASVTMFPSIQNEELLLQLYKFLDDHSEKLIDIEFFIAIFGLIVTIFHLVVLTRKSVMVSSVTSLMIGIAICDWISMAVVVGIQPIALSYYADECTPPPSYPTLILFNILLPIRDDVITCSTWLSILMTFIRWLSLKYKWDAAYKNVAFGFYSFGISFLISSNLSILKYLRTRIVENGTWTPPIGCENLGKIWMKYDIQASDFFNSFFLRVFNFVNGFLSRMLPSILLPVLTLLLVLEIQWAKKQVISSWSVVKKSTDRTTTLVILVAITCFVANLPSGIFTLFQVIYTDIGFIKLSGFVDRYCNAILTVNSIVHCVICFIMSTDYRNVAKKMLRIQSKTPRVSSVI